ncbi:MAG: methyltransferase domain-containing protein [Bacteroidales bacterium]|nr:methyltransferase domain-containing protein [Bacteroidales bacterium]
MEKKSVCPWWMGYLLLNPLRKLSHKPEEILEPYLKPGMNAVDFGCAMGYFSLPMAKMVGKEGKVYCFDIQKKMLSKLTTRASDQGLSQMIKPILINEGDTYHQYSGTIDFILLFAVAHEVNDQRKLFADLSVMMKPGALMLFSEPSGHVKQSGFDQSLAFAALAGLEKAEERNISRSMSILLRKS